MFIQQAIGQWYSNRRWGEGHGLQVLVWGGVLAGLRSCGTSYVWCVTCTPTRGLFVSLSVTARDSGRCFSSSILQCQFSPGSAEGWERGLCTLLRSSPVGGGGVKMQALVSGCQRSMVCQWNRHWAWRYCNTRPTLRGPESGLTTSP